MEPKKISFGFMKTKKVNKPILAEKKDYIECVEEKSIKVLGGEIIEEKQELVIPMKPNTLMTAERLQQIAEEVESGILEPEPTDKPPQVETVVAKEKLTLDQMAERELLEEAKKEVEAPNLTVPMTLPPLDGQKESTLDDYENIPIADFGMAMLRGMGWKPSNDQSKYKQPILRPKGLGLGAETLIKKNQQTANGKEKEKELIIIKNGFVKITSGKYSGFYGKVVSLDEDNGRVMVDITMKKETVSLSEFMMEAVTKAEYDQQSRVINSEKYEKYKESERNHVKIENSSESIPKSRDSPRPKLEKAGNSGSSRSERDKQEATRYDKNGRNNDYGRHQDRPRSKRYSSNDSISSDDERQDRRKFDKKHSEYRRDKKYDSSDVSSISDSDLRPKHRERRKDCRSDSSSDSYKKSKKTKKVKRDIDKKRKGKKKKRDRDRSPNFKRT